MPTRRIIGGTLEEHHLYFSRFPTDMDVVPIVPMSQNDWNVATRNVKHILVLPEWFPTVDAFLFAIQNGVETISTRIPTYHGGSWWWRHDGWEKEARPDLWGETVLVLWQK